VSRGAREVKPQGRASTDDPLASLSRRVVVAVTGWLLACAALGWTLTVRQAEAMGGMASGLGQLGTGMPLMMTAPVFLAMWVGMMVAMMFPTAVPIVAAHYTVVRRRGEGSRPTVAFVAGYLLVWSLVGVLPLTALLAFRQVAASVSESRWLPSLAGATLVIAGLYQFSGWKSVCLRACRSPLAFLMQHDFGGGARSALRAGLSHGAYCLGCCWALMSVLLVVGLMNLVWMVILTLVFLAEKCLRHGALLPRVVGTALVVLGAAVVVHPPLLQLIAGAAGAPEGM
jgi:predicted metal-binding membrane protein